MKILFLVVLAAMAFILKSEDYLFWIILLIWLPLIWVLKINSAKSMRFTLTLFLSATFLYLLGIHNVSEFTFRLSLISLIIAMSQATLELKKEESSNENFK